MEKSYIYIFYIDVEFGGRGSGCANVGSASVVARCRWSFSNFLVSTWPHPQPPSQPLIVNE